MKEAKTYQLSTHLGRLSHGSIDVARHYVANAETQRLARLRHASVVQQFEAAMSRIMEVDASDHPRSPSSRSVSGDGGKY